MKVYVVTVNQAYEDEVMDTNYPKAFDSLDKAKAELKKFADDDAEMDKKLGWIFADENNDEYFEAWKDGEYTGNHTLAQVVELEVA